jgi:2,4-dienoyl-CoA reductase-like NADH-dependent reductase (Old Yellow Enzyme family)
MMTIFEPYHFRKAKITSPNRIVLAPMTNTQSHTDGTLGEDEYHWLVRRAKEGFGIICTCAAYVSQEGKAWNGQLGIASEKHLPGLKRLAEGISQHGSLSIVQLFHGGLRADPAISGMARISACELLSDTENPLMNLHKATKEDIERLKRDFVNAALMALEAGFSGVELHAAHGYLFHQFLSKKTNQRTDEYGGSYENRTRFLKEVLSDCRKHVPDSFLLGVRISPEDKYSFEGIDFDESLTLARQLSVIGADYIDVSPWDAFKKPEKYPDQNLSLITRFRNALHLDTPVLVAGKIWSGSDAERAIALGADFVSIGRAAIGNADWPSRAKEANGEFLYPPFTVTQLKEADLGEAFIKYMRNWKGFVAE